MRFVIVTGMSGSGKTEALKMLEDAGYFCVDNLPLELIGKFAELAANPAQEYSKVALGLDVRSLYKNRDRSSRVEDFFGAMQEYAYEILFLDCGVEQLVRRYKASRRRHPLAGEGRIEDGIRKERALLEELKNRADYVIDTSDLLTRQLRGKLDRIFAGNPESSSLFVSILSFGYKYGIPADADLVFDVRFLPNPFYVDDLKNKTGNDREVRDYVCQTKEADEFLLKLTDLLEFLFPRYLAEGKRQLLIAVGCTGGKHRSVTVTNMLSEYFAAEGKYPVVVLHRDISR